MLHYLLLIIYTLIILFLTWRIWKKTKSILFPLGFALIYYWSLLGSWFLIYDELTGQKGKEFGLDYYGYFDLLFPVHADNMYLYAITIYALFIITIQLSILFFIKPLKQEENNTINPIEINHLSLLVFCVLGVVVSCVIVWKEILTAAKFHQSVYVVTRLYHGNWFALHQLINQVIVVSLYIGLIVLISGDKGKYITGDRKKIYPWLYIVVVFLVEGYLLFLGNKREIFFGGVLGILFYLSNVNNKINYKYFSFFILIILIPLFFNDGLRSYSPSFLAQYFDISDLEFHPETEVIYKKNTPARTAYRFLFSNEMFVPHFSMYGVLSHNVSPTYGSSILSLLASFIPHALWPDRPAGIYEYYAEQVNAVPGRGYTIHHASAWYLNFKIFGVLAGGILFGWIWSFLFNKFNSLENMKQSFLKIVFIIGISAFTANIPSLIRSGPEGYKALIFEAIVLPAVVILLSNFIQLKTKSKK